MKKINNAVRDYQDSLRAYLHEELQANGGSYQEWYDDLAPLREYIYNKHILFKIGKEFYVNRALPNVYGDMIDHHIVSYLAPMEFKRVGWNGNKLYPFEQIKIVSDYIQMGGVDLSIYPCPTRALSILS